LVTEVALQQNVQAIDTRGVSSADGGYQDDIAVDQLDAVIFVKDARFAEAVILLRCEQSPLHRRRAVMTLGLHVGCDLTIRHQTSVLPARVLGAGGVPREKIRKTLRLQLPESSILRRSMECADQ
jgi:hypothetical protein